MSWLDIVNLLVNLLAIISGLFTIRMADKAIRIIFAFLILNFISELFAEYTAYYWRNNLVVYNIFGFVSLVSISYYYNEAVDVFYKYKIGYLTSIACLVFGLYNLLAMQAKSLNIYFIVLESVVILIMSLFAITRLLLTQPAQGLIRNPHLWISIVLAFSWTMTYCYLALFAYDESKKLGLQGFLLKSQLCCNSLTYISFTLIFLLLVRPKELYND